MNEHDVNLIVEAGEKHAVESGLALRIETTKFSPQLRRDVRLAFQNRGWTVDGDDEKGFRISKPVQ